MPSELELIILGLGNEVDFKNCFRSSKGTVIIILNMIGPTILSNTDRLCINVCNSIHIV